MCLGAFPPAKKQPSKGEQPAHSLHPSSHSSSHVFYSLLSLAVPLMGNRLVLNILGSAEAVWIPNRLMAYGLTDSQALSLYGVLTSMAMPFIFFPSAITNSMAVLIPRPGNLSPSSAGSAPLCIWLPLWEAYRTALDGRPPPFFRISPPWFSALLSSSLPSRALAFWDTCGGFLPASLPWRSCVSLP